MIFCQRMEDIVNQVGKRKVRMTTHLYEIWYSKQYTNQKMSYLFSDETVRSLRHKSNKVLLI